MRNEIQRQSTMELALSSKATIKFNIVRAGIEVLKSATLIILATKVARLEEGGPLRGVAR